MSVLENFKNIPRSPYGGRQGSNVIFFSNLQRSPWRKKRGGLSPPPQRATGACIFSLPFEPAICRHSIYHLSIKIQEKKEG